MAKCVLGANDLLKHSLTVGMDESWTKSEGTDAEGAVGSTTQDLYQALASQGASSARSAISSPTVNSSPS